GITNATGGSVTVDSAIGGYTNLNLHANDLINHGQFQLTGNTTARLANYTTSSTATFVNSASGTVEILGTGSRDFEPSLDNSGQLMVSTNCNFGDNSPLTTSINGGAFQIEAGATAQLWGNFTNDFGGTIGGNGTLAITSATSFTNNGTIAPGASIGSLTITGSPSNGTTAGFDIELDATGNDFLQVNGNLALNGTLRPMPINGFVPSPTDSFVIMQCTGTLSGNFTSIQQPFGFGVFVVEVDTVSKQVILSFDLTGPLSFEDFQSIYFTPEQIANGDADAGNDFDGDGLSNELEWIHGLDPTSPFLPAPPFRIERNGANIDLIFLESNLLPASVQVEVLTTLDLVSTPGIVPSTDAPRTSETPLPGYPNIDEVTFHLTDPTWTGSVKRFFQLEFTDTPP
ncbi:MAG: hypothetical protein WBG04_21930, partial [Haloferula sp.]